MNLKKEQLILWKEAMHMQRLCSQDHFLKNIAHDEAAIDIF